MVAYSFKRRFVDPIRVGLSSIALSFDCAPKRQTIRAIGKRRHARPGETLQLYCGMRSKQCFKIGEAQCADVVPIKIRFSKYRRPNDSVILPNHGYVNRGYEEGQLDHFAVADGFISWEEMYSFWQVNHPGVTDFDGVLIKWRPVS